MTPGCWSSPGPELAWGSPRPAVKPVPLAIRLLPRRAGGFSSHRAIRDAGNSDPVTSMPNLSGALICLTSESPGSQSPTECWTALADAQTMHPRYVSAPSHTDSARGVPRVYGFWKRFGGRERHTTLGNTCGRDPRGTCRRDRRSGHPDGQPSRFSASRDASGY